jgi:molecular chaperone IbpA
MPLDENGVLSNFFVAMMSGAERLMGSARRAPVVSGVCSYPSCSMEDLAMRTFDFTPLWRSSIGFDRLIDLVDAAQRNSEESYPPYNIERVGDNQYQISLALAGFAPSDVNITAEQNVVTIEGRKNEEKREFLYHGISARAFRRQFSLADHVEVKGASFENGILRIDLYREVPEAMKPRKIEINEGSSNVLQIEAKAA